MRNAICTIILWGLTQLSFAEVSCVRPSLSATIYFSNGIKTDVRSAKASRAALEAALGTDYNGHALDYAIAYNETSGMAVDLAQPVLQHSGHESRHCFPIQRTIEPPIWRRNLGFKWCIQKPCICRTYAALVLQCR